MRYHAERGNDETTNDETTSDTGLKEDMYKGERETRDRDGEMEAWERDCERAAEAETRLASRFARWMLSKPKRELLEKIRKY